MVRILSMHTFCQVRRHYQLVRHRAFEVVTRFCLVGGADAHAFHGTFGGEQITIEPKHSASRS
jgi:hypothetical protein